MGGHIVAMGGGGFSMEPDNPRLDAYVLSLARMPNPKVLFVGTASGDHEGYQLKFYNAFAKLDCRPAVMNLFAFDRTVDLHQLVMGSDVIYVGGGNTPAMLAVWQLYGLGESFRAALAAGSVLAGISAGANCWFERSVTDSIPGGGVIDGLGFAPGCFCPHYDGEAWRQPLVQRLVDERAAGGGFACEDSAAVVLDAKGRLVQAVASVDGKRAWRWAEGTLAPLDTHVLG